MASASLEIKTRAKALKLKRRKLCPAVVVGAEKSRVKSVGQSGLLNSADIVNKLNKKLKSLGTLYKKRNGNSLGCCVEINAANDVLVKQPTLKLDQIVFSTPIRPRTMQKIKMCKNSKQTFS